MKSGSLPQVFTQAFMIRYLSCSQFDNDGDKALIISDELIVNIAKRNMENIVPLYYEMSVAQKQEINSRNIYEALTLAYGINIGSTVTTSLRYGTVTI